MLVHEAISVHKVLVNLFLLEKIKMFGNHLIKSTNSARLMSKRLASSYHLQHIQRKNDFHFGADEDHKNAHEDLRINKIPNIKGFEILRNPKLNKSTAFTIPERQILGIHGLLPPAVNSQRVQMDRVMKQLRKLQTDLQRYIQLTQILARNERLFYQLLREYTEELLPIVYTPTVGQACQQYGLIFRDPRGLFITIHDLGHVYDIVTNWPQRKVQAVVLTDGERILGLGDLGCNGMGIPIGKLALYTACGGIHPNACLPIMIDVGTNNEALLNDPMYIGIRQRRDTSEKYDQLVDEVIMALRKRFGNQVLIQFEDFGSHNSFRLLDRYRDFCCTFNDDIQGTAAVGVAGLFATLLASGMKLTDHKFLFFGAGGAACGIAHLIVRALMKMGLSKAQACKRIFMFDKDGLVTMTRFDAVDMPPERKLFAHNLPNIDSLEETVKTLKPTALLGVSGVGKTFTEGVCRQMCENTARPVIFALSNPTSHAECTPEEAYNWTDGKCIFASGSPFDPVTLPNGKVMSPGQGNNVYIFPGIALGVIASGAQNITEEMFLVAAEALAEQVTEADLDVGRVYPPLTNIKEVSFQIALRVAQVAYLQGLATVMPEPEDKHQLVRSVLYSPDYKSYLPTTYDYPDSHEEDFLEDESD
eukprot:TCONS_00009261-protein